MPTKATRLCLNYRADVRPFAKVAETERRVIVAFLTDLGFHLSLHRKPDQTETHIEYSSRHARGSAWDSARIGIMQKERNRQPERHACYFLNQPLRNYPGLNAPLFAQRFSVESFPTTFRARHARLPRLVLTAPSPTFSVSFHFSADDSAGQPNSTVLKTTLGTLSLQITA
jgi:hypothetical protein